MKRLVVSIVLLMSPSLLGSGFDDAILWVYDIPLTVNTISDGPLSICGGKFQSRVLYTRPYRISQLHWNDVFAKKGFGRWGISGRFNSYGMDGYYNRYIYDIGIAVSPIDSLAVSVNSGYHHENFAGLNRFKRLELDLKISYHRLKFKVAAGFSGITISEDYELPSGNNPRPWGVCSYDFTNGNVLWVSLRKFENNRVRWFFGQNLSLSPDFDLSIGMMNGPDLIFGRIVYKYGSMSVDWAYYSLGRLNDTLVIGFGYGG